MSTESLKEVNYFTVLAFAEEQVQSLALSPTFADDGVAFAVLARAEWYRTEDAGEMAKIEAVLDDFHAAASDADEERYFSHLAESGVFLGTDATERWSVPEFRAYAESFFPNTEPGA